jgi:hypothetical protein
MTLIVAGGIAGLTVGAAVGATFGYKLGVYSAWRLVTGRLSRDSR